MESKLLKRSILLALLAASVSGVFGCSKLEPGKRSPRHDEYDDQKVYYSDYVMFGETKKVVSGDQFPYHDIEGIKTIEFVVDCVYKGDKPITDRTIYVTGVGNFHNELPGCPPASLESGKKAMLYLRRLQGQLDNLFEIEYAPFSESEYVPGELILDEVIITCGLNLSQVFDENMCFEVLEYPDCYEYVPITPEPDTTAKESEPSTTPVGIFTSAKTPDPITEFRPTKEPIVNYGSAKESESTNKPTVIFNSAEEPGPTTALSGPQVRAGAVAVQMLPQRLAILIFVSFILA